MGIVEKVGRFVSVSLFHEPPTIPFCSITVTLRKKNPIPGDFKLKKEILMLSQVDLNFRMFTMMLYKR